MEEQKEYERGEVEGERAYEGEKIEGEGEGEEPPNSD